MEYYHYVYFIVILCHHLPSPTTSYILIRPNQRASQGEYDERSVANLAERIAETTARKLKYLLEDYKVIRTSGGHAPSDDNSDYKSAETVKPYHESKYSHPTSNEDSNEGVKYKSPAISIEEERGYIEEQIKDADPVPDVRGYSDDHDDVGASSDYVDDKKELESSHKDRMMINGKYYERAKDDQGTGKKNSVEKIRVIRIHSDGKLNPKEKDKVVSKLIDHDIERNKEVVK